MPQDPNNLTGPWSGMVGAVRDGPFDFSTATFSVTSQRMAIIDFSAAIYTDWEIAVVRTPKPESRRWIFVQLMQPLVWVVVLSGIGVVGVGFWMINNLSPGYKWQSDEDPLVREMKRFGYAICYFAFSIVAEGESGFCGLLGWGCSGLLFTSLWSFPNVF